VIETEELPTWWEEISDPEQTVRCKPPKKPKDDNNFWTTAIIVLVLAIVTVAFYNDVTHEPTTPTVKEQGN
jgi:hypothetical protein